MSRVETCIYLDDLVLTGNACGYLSVGSKYFPLRHICTVPLVHCLFVRISLAPLSADILRNRSNVWPVLSARK